MNTTIEKIETIVNRIASGKHDIIKPGETFTFNGAATVGDAVDQGDVIIEIVGEVFEGMVFKDQENREYRYVKIEKPTVQDKQLVIGNTEGAKHCLNVIKGIEMFRPSNWSEESLLGPCIRIDRDVTILHPKHGNVIIEASREQPRCILFSYQREQDKELQQERRARD